MKNKLPEDLPLELISESLTGDLSDDDRILLNHWLESSSGNKEKYLSIQGIWKDGMEDYQFYKLADEKKAWKALSIKLKPSNQYTLEEISSNRPKIVRTFAAIAAIFLGLIVIGVWIFQGGNHEMVYQTNLQTSQRITLKDGTLITLGPGTKIVVSSYFNKTNRIVRMYTGHASFEVGPRTDKPFIVQLGITQITDIGTIFAITKNTKEITAEVTIGKVLFSKLSSSDFKELDAGTSVTFDIQKERFGEVAPSNTTLNNKNTILEFENTSLSDVVVVLQKIYHKKIILQDQTLAGKRITAKLGGMSYNNALKVLCKSLDLEYSIKDSVYLLKNKTSEEP